MTLAITGASGALGRTVTDLVPRTVNPIDLVLTTRNPDNLADLATA